MLFKDICKNSELKRLIVLLSCVLALCQMFPTMFKPDKSLSVFKVMVYMLEFPEESQRVCKEVSQWD